MPRITTIPMPVHVFHQPPPVPPILDPEDGRRDLDPIGQPQFDPIGGGDLYWGPDRFPVEPPPFDPGNPPEPEGLILLPFPAPLPPMFPYTEPQG